MAEQLLTPEQAARKLAVSKATFYRLRPKLIARGMKVLRLGQSAKYTESSLDKMIEQAVRTGRGIAE